MIHLDTSFLIRALIKNSREDARMRAWLRDGDSVEVSAITWAEFLCGPVPAHVAEEAAELLGEPIALAGLDATLAAQLFNETGRRRGSLPDCLIAATAMNAGAALATSNSTDFRRFEATVCSLRFVLDA